MTGSMFNSLFNQIARPSCKLCSCLRNAPNLNANQIRTTYILKRRFEPGLAKKGSDPGLRTRHFIYDLVEDTNLRSQRSIKCILIKNVEGIGEVGDIVLVRQVLFRRHLFPAGAAVYCNNDHIKEYSHLLKSKDLTADSKPTTNKFIQKTLKELSGFHVRICMNGDLPWMLDKNHVRIACRYWGVTLKEDCITLPDEPITEPKTFSFRITVNGDRFVDANATVYEVFENEHLNEPIEFPSVWGNKQIVIPEQQNIYTPTESSAV